MRIAQRELKKFCHLVVNKNEKFALVPRPPDALEKAALGAKRILSCMVGDTLALATSKFRIGGYEWHEAEYLQLMAWAEQLGLSPDELLRRLKGEETTIENNRFITLRWDVGLLPLSEFRVSQELRLTQLSFVGPGYDLPPSISRISTVALPELKRLDCAIVGLKTLATGRMTSLESLECSGNHLKLLDLEPFPNLKTLNCFINCLTTLNLTHVPQLVELDCSDNLIAELDLRSVPNLRRLNCSDNNMQKLVLRNLPKLVELDCENSAWDKSAGWGRHLEMLDLRGAPNLTRLNCWDNALEYLDLRCVPQLEDLNCASNLLTELDIRPLFHLKKLLCDDRTRLIQHPDQHFKS